MDIFIFKTFKYDTSFVTNDDILYEKLVVKEYQLVFYPTVPTKNKWSR